MPAPCVIDCGEDLQLQIEIECGNYKEANAPAIALMFCKEAYDKFKSDLVAEADVETTANLLPYPNTFLILKKGNAEYTVDEKTQDSPVAGETTVQTGNTVNATFSDPNVNVENQELYKLLATRKKAYVALAYTDGTTELSDMMLNIYAVPAGTARNTIRQNMLKASGEMPNGKAFTLYNYQVPEVFGIEGI